MSLQGILLIDFLALGFIVLILNLVRIKKLYVGYAIIWIGAVTALMVMVSIPSLLYLLPELMGAVYPASALTLLAFVFVFLVLIFMSVKLTTLSSRQVELIQRLAVAELREREARAKAEEYRKIVQSEIPQVRPEETRMEASTQDHES